MDLEKVQSLQDSIAGALNISLVLCSPDGKPITQPSNYTRLCRHFIMNDRQRNAYCINVHNHSNFEVRENCFIGKCPMTGLTESIVAITIGGTPAAYWICGQIREKDSLFPENNDLHGEDEFDALKKAFEEIPVSSAEELVKISSILNSLSLIISDLVERNLKQQEKESVLSSFRTAIDQSPVSIVITDSEGTIEYVNRKFCQITGYSEGESIGSNPRILKSGEQGEDYYRNLWETLGKGEIWKGRFHNRRKDGSLFREDALISPVIDDKGQTVNYVAIKEDIGSRLKEREEKDRLLQAVEQSSDIIEMIDRNGIIFYANRASVIHEGKEIIELLGKPLPELYYSSNKYNFQYESEIWKTLRGGFSWNGRMTSTSSTGRLTIEDINISPVSDDQKKTVAYLVIKRDITDSYRIEEERKNIREQIYLSQKMESLGQMAANIAHDFNNILQGIMTPVQLILESGIVRDEHSLKYLDMIRKSSLRASELIENLMNYGRKSMKEHSLIHIVSLVNETVSLSRHILKKGIELDLEVINDPGTVTGSHAALESVFLNILMNSDHAIAKSGHIQIRVDRESLSEQYCNDCSYTVDPGQYCSIEFRDDGSGIEEKNLEKIFTSFFTTRKNEGGTGLGLYSAMLTIKEHKGALEIKSRKGEGTSIKILLPLSTLPEEK